MSKLKSIVLRLARNPDAGFPNGDDTRGYRIVAPLNAHGLLDLDLWRANKDQCTVVRFSPDDAEKADGWLSHHGAQWYFRYDDEEDGPDEPIFRLGDHKLVVGEYATVHEADGDALVYRVAEAHALKA
ncbi:MAG: hypothetical protein AB7T58_14710 [Hyphomonadaceae bacterium]